MSVMLRKFKEREDNDQQQGESIIPLGDLKDQGEDRLSWRKSVFSPRVNNNLMVHNQSMQRTRSGTFYFSVKYAQISI